MAAGTATATLYDFPKGVDNTQRFQILRGTIAISAAGTYPPSGFAINWANLANAGGGRPEALANSSGSIIPVEVDVQSMAVNPRGYVYVVDANGNLRVFVSANAASGTSGPLVEGVGTASNNIPGDLSSDTIVFAAYFVRN